MAQNFITVEKPGLLTTVQDMGRWGYQQFGMVVSGAMDEYALRMANRLVGNEAGAAALEITMIGPVLQVMQDSMVAITGGDLSPTLNGNTLPMWQSCFIPAGATIAFGPVKAGCRAYLAVSGGIDVPLVMGSRSTYLRAGLGGFAGRALQKGDVIKRGEGDRMSRGKRLSPSLIPHYAQESEVRVIVGPQAGAFTEQSKQRFFATSYLISPQSDRMGYRLTGEKLVHRDRADIISDAIPLGAIQVPASGEPILLLADRQTTGGYPKIAVVIAVDLPKVAQAKPGDRIRFIPVTLEESQRLLAEQERMFTLLNMA